MLERSGADLGEVSEAEPEEAAGDAPAEPAPSEAAASGSDGAGEVGSIPTRADTSKRGPKVPISVAEPSGGDGLRR